MAVGSVVSLYVTAFQRCGGLLFRCRIFFPSFFLVKIESYFYTNS